MVETIRPPSDIRLALMYIRHIKSPCVEPTTGRNNRDYWIDLAEKAALPFMSSPFAKSLLENTIAKYK